MLGAEGGGTEAGQEAGPARYMEKFRLYPKCKHVAWLTVQGHSGGMEVELRARTKNRRSIGRNHTQGRSNGKQVGVARHQVELPGRAADGRGGGWRQGPPRLLMRE